MDFLLAKRKRLEHKETQKRMHETVAKVALKYGVPCDDGYTDTQISEFWNYDSAPPCREMFRRYIRIADIKRVIHNALRSDHEIWNADFLHGLAKNCDLINNSKSFFPSLKWRNNLEIDKIVLASPFGGTMGKNLKDKNSRTDSRWSCVAALDLRHEEPTLSFIAGVLSAGQIVYEDGHHFSKHKDGAIAEIKKLNIPIEKEVKIKKFRGFDHYVLISPIWGALFSKKMPQEVRDKWFNLKDAYKINFYSAILWRTYVNTKFRVNGIPYLKSRRMIFYEYKCEEGAMKKLESLRFEMKLTQLDYCIRDIVKEWANNNKKVYNSSK